MERKTTIVRLRYTDLAMDEERLREAAVMASCCIRRRTPARLRELLWRKSFSIWKSPSLLRQLSQPSADNEPVPLLGNNANDNTLLLPSPIRLTPPQSRGGKCSAHWRGALSKGAYLILIERITFARPDGRGVSTLLPSGEVTAVRS